METVTKILLTTKQQQRKVVSNLVFPRKNYMKFLTVWQVKSTTPAYQTTLARKSFSAKNKISVKFTDDVGNSEGAVDMGGPMKELFTLVIQWMLTSQLFCGPEHHKFLSFQSMCLEGNDYYFAGMLIAMSLVHGGSGPQCFAHNMFEALIRDPDKIPITIEDVYDMELQSSLQNLCKP